MPRELISVADLKEEYVVCRAIGHTWDDNPTAELDSTLWRAGAAALALRCTRCTTERFDYLAADMTVFHRYYRYPEHYNTSIPGQGTKPNLRGELLSRSVLLRRPPANSSRRRRGGS